jgi:hypothetical protein
MEQSTRFIGMDVHKATIVVAITAMGEVGKATAYGTVPKIPPRRWRSWWRGCARPAAGR